MLYLLTPEEAAEAQEAQRQHYKKALAETLRRYPGVDPIALFFFGTALGNNVGLINQVDMDWALAEIRRMESAP